MAEKAILAGLAGLTKGIAEGLKLRQDRELKEKELESKAASAQQESAMKMMDMQLKQSTVESRNQYFKELADINREKLNVAKQAAGIKSTQAKGDVAKDYYSQLNSVEKNIMDAQDKLSQIETDKYLQKKNPDAWQRQYDEAKGNVDSLSKTRQDLKTKIDNFSKPGKVSQKQSQKFFEVMKMLENPDFDPSQMTDEFSKDLESLQGNERKKAAEKLSEIME